MSAPFRRSHFCTWLWENGFRILGASRRGQVVVVWAVKSELSELEGSQVKPKQKAASSWIRFPSQFSYLIFIFFYVSQHVEAQPSSVDYTSVAKEYSFIIEDFQFAGGDTLQELRINYATWGQPRRDTAGNIVNAVLLCHGTGGSWHSFTDWWATSMFGPGQPLDITQYFVIASDAIGSGNSSKPSDGLRMEFPNYQIDDIVEAQYQLVTEELGVHQLLAVIGISFGGRQAWQWGIQYPAAMHGLVPVISSPFPNAGRRGMQDFLPIEAITKDPSWQGGAYAVQPTNLPLAFMMYWVSIGGAGHLYEAAPTREQAFSFLPEIFKKRASTLDANDFIYSLRANDGFDVYSEIDRVKAKVLMINMAGDELVPIELGHAENALEKLGSKAEYLLVNEASGYGHIAVAFTAKFYGPKMHEFLRELTQN